MELHWLLQKAAPEIIEVFEKRYTILKSIYTHQPIGRRTLSTRLSMGERIIRSETTVLRETGLIEMKATGMVITPEGEEVLDGLWALSGAFKGFLELEQRVAKILKIRRVVIVPGNSDGDISVRSIIGKAAAKMLGDMIHNNSTIAVTGGSSVCAVALALSKIHTVSDIMVIPARGGIGKEVEYQSNTIASIFAKKLGGGYKLLHLPDQLTAEASETLLNDPDTKQVIDDIKHADILICGIGRAEDMASKRNVSTEQFSALMTSGAVAEAFGYYFNRKGEIIFASNSIGLHFEDLRCIPEVVGVAGGKQKAEAIIAVLTGWTNSTLITDEAAALEILILSGQQ